MIRRRQPMTCILAVLALAATTATAATPPYYTKKATWHETMLASREAMMRLEAETEGTSTFKPFVSKVKRGGRGGPSRVVVDVRGVQQLWLVATYGPDDYHHDRAVWGEPVLVDQEGPACHTGARSCFFRELPAIEGRAA